MSKLKKKQKKSVTIGIANIQTTFNNTISAILKGRFHSTSRSIRGTCKELNIVNTKKQILNYLDGNTLV